MNSVRNTKMYRMYMYSFVKLIKEELLEDIYIQEENIVYEHLTRHQLASLILNDLVYISISNFQIYKHNFSNMFTLYIYIYVFFKMLYYYLFVFYNFLINVRSSILGISKEAEWTTTHSLIIMMNESNGTRDELQTGKKLPKKGTVGNEGKPIPH